ncbi:MOSC domain-containing protein [Epidermidibacterium keratini]|uniref:MOSC domain-containing protein n=1 Tax=Epidermidibacterium keratini TaxID=1891644 RepID=A0A7L4YLN5_9ACTN|nr:MOSC N-terminal beta barrel domain-containing protein [Epidermidibacterium keratini]QHC00040.1 MOSC domain-containing protein [Epidermidibacterium keratini]
MAVTISRLFYYPLKSGRRIETQELDITSTGAAGDRVFMVVDESGELVSQREIPALALVESRDVIAACESTGNVVPVKLHSWRGEGEDQGDLVAAQLSAQLGVAVRVVRFPDDFERRTTQGAGVAVYQDGYPITVTSTASLAQVSEWLGEDLPIERFRPNILLDGLETPFEEDDILSLRIGEVELDFVKLCGRCVMTTIDQDTAEKGREPLRELGKRRVLPQLGGGREIMFAVNAVPRATGTIRVGDEVQIERADRPYAERIASGEFRG